LHRQVDAITDENAAEVKLIYAPDWPSEATLIDESGFSARSMREGL
jgi:hypothetical protein